MDIRSICRRNLVTVDAASSLAHAAGLMREHHVGFLIVTSNVAQEQRVNGVVTDRDLVIDAMARGLDASRVPVGELANDRIVGIQEDEDIGRAIALMQESGVRRLLVSNAEHRLTGVLSLDDVISVCAAQLDGLADLIRTGMQRESAQTAAGPGAPVLLRFPAAGTAGWGSGSAQEVVRKPSA